MFNLYPGGGLGFSASKEIAFGLAPVSVTEIEYPVYVDSGGGYSGGGSFYSNTCQVFDNGYSVTADDDEITEILSIILGVING